MKALLQNPSFSINTPNFLSHLRAENLLGTTPKNQRKKPYDSRTPKTISTPSSRNRSKTGCVLSKTKNTTYAQQHSDATEA